MLPTPEFPKRPCALPCNDTLFIVSFSTVLRGLHAFTASQEILEYNSSLGCHLGYYFPLFKTLETRHRTNAVVLIGEELVITPRKWYHTF